MEDQAFLTRAADAAEYRMRDTCVITVQSKVPGAIDPATGWPAVVAGTVIYGPAVAPDYGKCRLRMAGKIATSGSSASQVAGDQVVTSTPMLHLPLTAPRVPVEALVELTGVPADDPAGHLRLGLRLRVTGPHINTDASAQRLTVEAVTG